MSNYHGGVKNRQRRALHRLQEQLASGTKPQKMAPGVFGNGKSTIFVDLTDADRNRIEKEITTLKTKV